MPKKKKTTAYWVNSKGQRTDLNDIRIDSQTVWSLLAGENPSPRAYKALTDAVAAALGRVAEKVAEDWRDELNEWAGPVTSQKMPDGSGRMEVWQNPSKEGEFPHRRTGSLQRSITVKVNQPEGDEMAISIGPGGRGITIATARVFSDPNTPKEEEIKDPRGRSFSPREYSSLGGNVDYMPYLVEKMNRLGPDSLIDSEIGRMIKREVEDAVRSVFSTLDK
jgi:hypothetical protein